MASILSRGRWVGGWPRYPSHNVIVNSHSNYGIQSVGIKGCKKHWLIFRRTLQCTLNVSPPESYVYPIHGRVLLISEQSFVDYFTRDAVISKFFHAWPNCSPEWWLWHTGMKYIHIKWIHKQKYIMKYIHIHNWDKYISHYQISWILYILFR